MEDKNTYFMGLLCKLDRTLCRTLNKYSPSIALSFSPQPLLNAILGGINVESKSKAEKKPSWCLNDEKVNEA